MIKLTETFSEKDKVTVKNVFSIFKAKCKRQIKSRSGMISYNKDEELILCYHPFEGKIAIYRYSHTPKTPNGNSYILYKDEDEILKDFEPCE